MDTEEFKHIEKHLGNEWLEKQKEFINSKKWIKRNILKENIPTDPAYYFLGKINKLIKKFENVEGFSQWAIEAKNSGNSFKHFLFELMVLENLLLNTDELILKPHNLLSNKDPEALVRKGEISFYVEATFVESLPNSVNNLVIKLFNKSTKKFKGLQGIHFIGSFNFFKYEGDTRIPLPQFSLLNKLISLRYERGFGSSIIAFVPTEFVIKTLPNFKKTSIEKLFYINAKPPERGGLSNEFFKEIFDVDEFKILI